MFTIMILAPGDFSLGNSTCLQKNWQQLFYTCCICMIRDYISGRSYSRTIDLSRFVSLLCVLSLALSCAHGLLRARSVFPFVFMYVVSQVCCDDVRFTRTHADTHILSLSLYLEHASGCITVASNFLSSVILTNCAWQAPFLTWA